MNSLHISLTEFKNESRVLKQADSILKYGIAKKVYIASLGSNALKNKKEYSKNLILNRFNLKSRKIGHSIFIKIIKYIEFFFKVTLFYKNKNIKIISIHSIALFPLGIFLKYFYNSKLVYDTHELETETNGLQGMRKKIVKFMEKHLIKQCDLIFVVSENIADWYANEYKIKRPIVIKNAPKLFEQKNTNYFRKNLNIKSDAIIVLYQGGLSKGRSINLLLDTFKSRVDTQIVIVFMGYGELEKKIQETSLNYKNIFFHPAVSPNLLLEYTASADIGISFIENTCLSYYYCLPNKLFEYAMVSLPVIVSNMKEMAEVIRRYDMGIVVKENTSKALNKAIDKILKSDLEIMKKNARRCAEDNAWEIQEQKMLCEYKRVLDAR